MTCRIRAGEVARPLLRLHPKGCSERLSCRSGGPSCSGPPLLPIHPLLSTGHPGGGRIRRPPGPPRRGGGGLSSVKDLDRRQYEYPHAQGFVALITLRPFGWTEGSRSPSSITSTSPGPAAEHRSAPARPTPARNCAGPGKGRASTPTGGTPFGPFHPRPYVRSDPPESRHPGARQPPDCGGRVTRAVRRPPSSTRGAGPGHHRQPRRGQRRGPTLRTGPSRTCRHGSASSASPGPARTRGWPDPWCRRRPPLRRRALAQRHRRQWPTSRAARWPRASRIRGDPKSSPRAQGSPAGPPRALLRQPLALRSLHCPVRPGKSLRGQQTRPCHLPGRLDRGRSPAQYSTCHRVIIPQHGRVGAKNNEGPPPVSERHPVCEPASSRPRLPLPVASWPCEIPSPLRGSREDRPDKGPSGQSAATPGPASRPSVPVVVGRRAPGTAGARPRILAAVQRRFPSRGAGGLGRHLGSDFGRGHGTGHLRHRKVDVGSDGHGLPVSAGELRHRNVGLGLGRGGSGLRNTRCLGWLSDERTFRSVYRIGKEVP